MLRESKLANFPVFSLTARGSLGDRRWYIASRPDETNQELSWCDEVQ